jgi:hypothetical protein
MITEIIGAAASLLGAGAGMIAGNQTKKIGATFGYDNIGNSLTTLGRITGATSDLTKNLLQQSKAVTTAAGDTWGAIGKTLGTLGGAISASGGIINSVASAAGVDAPKQEQVVSPVSTQKMPDSSLQQLENPLKKMPSLKAGFTFTPGVTSMNKVDNPVLPLKEGSFLSVPQLKAGGVNKGEKTAVEAEGGEALVKFDDNYNILSITPIQGPSHSGGGVDMGLKKNEAVLNRTQQEELKKGVPLKEILTSLPQVEDTSVASGGAVNDDPPEGFWSKVAGYLNANANTGGWPWTELKPGEVNMFGSGPPQELPPDPNEWYYPKSFSDLEDRLQDIRDMDKKAKPPAAPDDSFGPPLLNPPGMAPVETPMFYSHDDYKKAMFGDGYPVPAPKPGQTTLKDTWDMVLAGKGGGSKTPTVAPPVAPKEKVRFGAEEATLLADNIRNLAALFQRNAQPIMAPNVKVPAPVMVTPKRTNPQPYMDENSKALRSALAMAMQHGQKVMVPSLMAGYYYGTNKIAEGITARDNESQDRALAQNAEASNRSGFVQAELDARTRDLNANLELEKSKVDAAKVNERISAAANLPLAWARYKKSAEDSRYADRMKQLIYYQMSRGIR